MRQTAKAILFLLAVGVVAYFIHQSISIKLGVNVSTKKLVWAYLANTSLTGGILVWLLNLPQKHKNALGYFFMYGSFAKFILFFVVFLPWFRADGQLTKPEFMAFFIPYAVCLVVETTVLILKLKAEDKAQ